jgi:hypothetical protein
MYRCCCGSEACTATDHRKCERVFRKRSYRGTVAPVPLGREQDGLLDHAIYSWRRPKALIRHDGEGWNLKLRIAS